MTESGKGITLANQPENGLALIQTKKKPDAAFASGFTIINPPKMGVSGRCKKLVDNQFAAVGFGAVCNAQGVKA